VKLLVMNPNITESVTQLIGAEARRAASPGTELTLLTATFGVAYIETELEALIGGYASLISISDHLADHDAIVMAAFGDPGIGALREAFDRPVVGLTEAALREAAAIAQRFSIIGISPRIGAWYRSVVEGYGYGDRLASIRTLDAPIRDIAGVQDEHGARLRTLTEEVVARDGAQAVIVAGAPLAGLARRITGLPVPLVDPIAAAVRQAQIAPRPRREAPPRKASAGLPEAIRRILSS
jgi:Asp/Glu/hydantoin racemase